MVGIDSSESLIAEAQTRSGHEQYLVHDATVVPFPVGPADVLYARFVVTHLKDPLAVIEEWASQLTEGGLLLLDEVEKIETTKSTLSSYLDVLNSLMTHEGRALLIGPRLDSIQTSGLLKIKQNAAQTLRVQDREAAAMFRLNLEAWRDRRFLIDTYGEAPITCVADQLEAIARNAKIGSTIEWTMRQMVFERDRP